MSWENWQAEISDLLAYGRRIGLDFDQAWNEALECVDVPPMCVRPPQNLDLVILPGRGQIALDVESVQSVLMFFKGVCRRAWAGEEVAPPGCFDTVLDAGGVSGLGKARSLRTG